MTDTTPERDEETHSTVTAGNTEITGGDSEELRFRSEDEECAATLYRPDDPAEEDKPCVVMGNGFSMTRRDGLPYFAERYADAGIATLTFDFRHLGDSDGEPRQLIDYQRQRADITAAIDFAQSLEGIDADRIATWGFSFGGGHAVHVAASDDRVAAVVAMFPFLDGLAAVRVYGLRTTVRLMAAAARAAVGRRPLRMPVTGPPGSPTLLNKPESEPGFAAVCAEDSNWRNEFLAKPSQSFLEIRPVRDAPDVRCPALFCLATEDTMMPLGAIERAADRAPRGELRRYSIGHFDGFLDAFENVVDDQIEFLDHHLASSPPA